LINLFLLFFNLIPLFPLDGEKVLAYFLPPNAQDTFDRIRPYGPLILMGLIFLGQFGGLDLIGYLVFTPAQGVFQLLV
jgi:Zn-dependent protease